MINGLAQFIYTYSDWNLQFTAELSGPLKHHDIMNPNVLIQDFDSSNNFKLRKCVSAAGLLWPLSLSIIGHNIALLQLVDLEQGTGKLAVEQFHGLSR